MKRYRGIEFLFDSVLIGFNCLIVLVILLFVVVIAIGFFIDYGLFAIPMLGVIFAWLYACGYFRKPKKPEEKGKAFKDGTPEEIAEREERAKMPMNRD